MKIVLFVIGVGFAYWNYAGMTENISAVWHFVAFALTLGVLGVMAFNWVFDFVTAPNYKRNSDKKSR